MRSVMLTGTAAAVLTTTMLLAVPASADRICKKVCHEGICRSQCVERGDRLYMRDNMRDRDYYHHHHRGVEVRGPGFNVDVGR
jgi:hypothetical protein